MEAVCPFRNSHISIEPHETPFNITPWRRRQCVHSETLSRIYRTTRDSIQHYTLKKEAVCPFRNTVTYLQNHTRLHSTLHPEEGGSVFIPKHCHVSTEPHETPFNITPWRRRQCVHSETLSRICRTTRDSIQHYTLKKEAVCSFRNSHTSTEPHETPFNITPWRRRQCVPPESWFLFIKPHGVTHQQTVTFTAIVKTLISHNKISVRSSKPSWVKQDRQCTYNGTFRRVRVTVVAVEKQ